MNPANNSSHNAPQLPGSPANGNAPASVGPHAAWQALLIEMTELHARLEYLRVMLKLGVRSF